jgi:lysophospholipase L1-like esterase
LPATGLLAASLQGAMNSLLRIDGARHEAARGVKSALANIALVAASMLVALLLIEVALRVADFSYPAFYRPDDQLGLRLRAGAEGWSRSEGEAFIKINSAGFRDRERTLAKPPEVFRIAVLGDSYAEALQVDLEKTFEAQLEERLNACKASGGKRIEVLNFGVSGYGTAQQLLNYRHFAAQYSPDLVLVAFFAGNDIRNNSRDLEPEKVRPFFVLDGDKLVEDRSFATSAEFQRRTNRLRAVLDQLRVLRLVQLVYFIKDRVQLGGGPAHAQPAAGAEAGLDDAVYREPATPQWRAAWAVTERLLARLRDETQVAGAKLLVATLSTGIQVHPDPAARAEFMRTRGVDDLFYPDRRIEQITARLGVQSILLAPKFQSVAEREKVFLHGFPNTRLGTGHWNEAGHRLAASIIAEELCRGGGSLH